MVAVLRFSRSKVALHLVFQSAGRPIRAAHTLSMNCLKSLSSFGC